MGFQRPFREDRDRAEEEKSEEEGQRGRVYCKGVSADLRGQHCYHHYWYSSERCSFLSLSLFSSRLFTMGHDIIPRRYTTPSLIDRLERERKEGETEGAINFHGPSTLAPSVFSFSIGETDTRAVYSYAIQRMVEEKAWDDVSLAAVRLIILSLSLFETEGLSNIQLIEDIFTNW